MSLKPTLTILNADCIAALKTLPDNSIHCCVTSPPYYGLRAYLKSDDPLKSLELGAEQTPQQYVEKMVKVFREVKRVLREDGVCWLNLGDSFGGTSGCHAGGSEKAQSNRGAVNVQMPSKGGKAKDLLMIPERVAMALQADGWYLRAKCPWIKRNAMPESVKDRPSQVVETIFMLTKISRYFYDAEAVKVPATHGGKTVQLGAKSFSKGQAAGAGIAPSGNGTKDTYLVPAKRTRRSSDWFFESWQGMLQDEDGDPTAFVVNTKPYRAAHFATFPPDLIRPMILSSTSEHGCCAACISPYKRILSDIGQTDHGGLRKRADAPGAETSETSMFRTGKITVKDTVGWQPTCDHSSAKTIPCTVLDPFGGSGTTAQVALELGCNAIVCELNAEYIPLIHQRCDPILNLT